LLRVQGFWGITALPPADDPLGDVAAAPRGQGPKQQAAPWPRCLLWVEQDIEPTLPHVVKHKAPQLIRRVLRRVSRRGVTDFLEVRSPHGLMTDWCLCARD
jgi:hypothetical protein